MNSDNRVLFFRQNTVIENVSMAQNAILEVTAAPTTP